MVSITKTVFRTALIGGLVVGGLTLVVGPQRVATGFTQIQHSVISWFDDNMDDPILLRQQLKHLQEEYPSRIRKITRSLAEVDGQIATISYQKQVSENAVNIAKDDLASLKGLVNTAKAEFASFSGMPQTVLIRFQGLNLTVDQAYARASKIKASALNNQDKFSHFERELEILNKYRNRLVVQKDKLDQEYSTFQTQLWNIQRQIDQIERNEDLIELLEECNTDVAENDQFKARNLGELSNRLSALQKEHDAVLDALENRVSSDSYEERAREAMRQADSFEEVFTIEDYQTPRIERGVFPTMPLIIDENAVRQQQAPRERETIVRLNKDDQN